MPELHPYDVIVRPIITEKSSALAEQENQYTFQVASGANKIQIREAVELIFDVDVEKVRTMIMPAKRGQRGRRTYIRKQQWKKAVVTLVDGDEIELFNV